MHRWIAAFALLVSTWLGADLKNELIAIEDQLAYIASLAKEDANALEIQERLDEIVKMADTSAKFKDIEETLLTVVAQSEQGARLENTVQDMQSQVDDLKAVNDYFIKENGVGDCGLTLNSTRPCRGSGLIVSLAYLYWKAFSSESEYAYSYQPTTSAQFPGDMLPRNGESEVVKFKAKSGIRAGLGYTLPYDGWDLNLIYTYFCPTQSVTKSGEALFPLFAYQPVAEANSVTRAHAHWRIRYQTLDFEWGRAFFVSPKVAFRPHMAVRGEWVDQGMHVDYSGGDLDAVASEYEVEGKSDFHGAGFRGGLNSTFFFGGGLHLFTDLAASLLFGPVDVRQKHMADDSQIASLAYQRSRLIPNLDMQAGLGWQIWFNNARNCFRLRLSYEMQYLWGLGEQPRYVDSSRPIIVRNAQDIGFQGLSIEGRMDF